jgi:hypothetical protein
MTTIKNDFGEVEHLTKLSLCDIFNWLNKSHK